uniref:Uncharacterized protein n=1 Tax=Panagrolaimus sp. JU765 TaxID=591449 RepID=A0AC34Q9B8_9BILA
MVASPVLLSLSAVFLFVGSCLILASGITTDWTEYEVDRKAIANNPEVAKKIGDSFLRNPIYFTRTYGLWHVCFPNNVPTDIGSYTYLTSTCVDNPDLSTPAATYDGYSTTQKMRYWALRATVGLLVAGFAVLVFAIFVGIISCWSQRTRYLKITLGILSVAILLLVIVICLYHLVQYWETSVLKMPPFFGSWDASLRQSTVGRYGVSYWGYWIGLLFLMVSAICFFLSISAIHRERDEAFENKHQAYLNYMGAADKAMMPYNYVPSYGGVNPYYPGSYYSQYPTMSGNSYYGYMTYGH